MNVKGFIKRILFSRKHPNSLAVIGSKREKSYGWAINLCFALWGLGCVMPLMTVTKLVVWDTDYSVFNLVLTLTKNGELFLLILVVLFGVINPIVKLSLLYRLWGGTDVQGDGVVKTFKVIDLISKWSMGDVFIVAITVVVLKTSGLFADATVRPGLFVFATAAIGSMLIATMLKKSIHARRAIVDLVP